MNPPQKPVGTSPIPGPYAFLRQNSPSPSAMPGLNLFTGNLGVPQSQPSLFQQMSKVMQQTLPGKVLNLAATATDNAQQMAQAPIEAGLSKVVNPAAAKVAASNAVSFLTPPSLSIAQGMNNMLKSCSFAGAGETSLTAAQTMIGKLGRIPALLVNQANLIKVVGQTFYGASKATQQQQQPPKRGMGM